MSSHISDSHNSEITFCDGLSECEIGGHVLVFSSYSEPKQFLYTRTSKCLNCDYTAQWERYKYMPEHEIKNK